MSAAESIDDALFELPYDSGWGYERRFFLDNEHRYTKMHRLLREALGSLDGRSILDLGCGRGLLLARFERYRGVERAGIEIDPDEAEQARAHGVEPLPHHVNGFEGTRMTARLPFDDDSFDVVLAGEIIEHVVDTEGFAGEIHRVLAPEGAAVLTTPNLLSWKNRLLTVAGRHPGVLEPKLLYGDDFGHVRLFSVGALRAVLEDAGFSSVAIVGKRLCSIGLLDRLPRSAARRLDRAADRLPALADGLLAVARS